MRRFFFLRSCHGETTYRQFANARVQSEGFVEVPLNELLTISCDVAFPCSAWTTPNKTRIATRTSFSTVNAYLEPGMRSEKKPKSYSGGPAEKMKEIKMQSSHGGRSKPRACDLHDTQ